MISNGSAQKPSRFSATMNGWRLQTVSVLDRDQRRGAAERDCGSNHVIVNENGTNYSTAGCQHLCKTEGQPQICTEMSSLTASST